MLRFRFFGIGIRIVSTLRTDRIGIAVIASTTGTGSTNGIGSIAGIGTPGGIGSAAGITSTINSMSLLSMHLAQPYFCGNVMSHKPVCLHHEAYFISAFL